MDSEIKSISKLIKGKKITNIYNIKEKNINSSNISKKKYPQKVDSSIKSNKFKENSKSLKSNNLKSIKKKESKIENFKKLTKVKTKKLKTLESNKINKKLNTKTKISNNIITKNKIKKNLESLNKKIKKKIKKIKKPVIKVKKEIEKKCKLNKDKSAKLIQNWWINNKKKIKKTEINTKYKYNNMKSFAKEEYKNWNKIHKLVKKYKKNISDSKVINFFNKITKYTQNLKEKLKNKFNFQDSNLLSTKRNFYNSKNEEYINNKKDIYCEKYPNSNSQKSLKNKEILNNFDNNISNIIMSYDDKLKRENSNFFINNTSNLNLKSTSSKQILPENKIFNQNFEKDNQNDILIIDSRSNYNKKDSDEKHSSYKSNEYEALVIPLDDDETIFNINENEKLENLILEILINDLIEDFKYNILIEELSPKNNYEGQKEVIYGIRTNLNAINEYLNLLINNMLEKGLEKYLNINLKNIFIKKMINLYLNKFGIDYYNCKIDDKVKEKIKNENYQYEIGFNNSLLPIENFIVLENEILGNYEHLEINKDLFLLQRIYHRCIFDCLNEKLKDLIFSSFKTNNYIKIIKNGCKPIIYKKNEIENILNISKNNVIDNSTYLCGILRDKEDSMMGNIKYMEDNLINNIREERLDKFVSNLAINYNLKFKNNNKEILFIYFELSELILEELVEELSKYFLYK